MSSSAIYAIGVVVVLAGLDYVASITHVADEVDHRDGTARGGRGVGGYGQQHEETGVG